MPDFETIRYEEIDGVAWVTLDRPEVHNAFNARMQEELRSVWTALRSNDDVRCAVLTASGDRAFCTGIDRSETLDAPPPEPGKLPGFPTPWTYDDPGRFLGPKSNDLWKPVIAAVNGMACGGAFYMLGEVEFIIAADHATFFDPHVTFNMVAAYEPIHLLAKMPFGEVMRLALLGSHERMSAQRAFQVGLVSEVVPAAGLHDAAEWAAQAIASQHPLGVGGTLRALWAGRELSRQQALDLAHLFVRIGNDWDVMAEGQQQFASGRRIEPRIR